MKRTNLLKVWPKLLEIDKRHRHRTHLVLQDWIVQTAPGRIGRVIEYETIPFMTRDEFLKLFNQDAMWEWARELSKAVEECE